MRIRDWSSDVCSSDLLRIGPDSHIAAVARSFLQDAKTGDAMTGVCVQSLSADALVTDLGSRVADVFAATISEGPVALVDFPDHSNVGDSAIWLGEMAWLDGNGRLPISWAALHNFSVPNLLRAATEGPLLIHGGGNFGTTWRPEKPRV